MLCNRWTYFLDLLEICPRSTAVWWQIRTENHFRTVAVDRLMTPYESHFWKQHGCRVIDGHIFLTFWEYVRNLRQFAESYSRRNSRNLSLMLGWWPVLKIFAGKTTDALESADITLTFCNHVQNLCRFDDSYSHWKTYHVSLMLCW